MHELLLSPDLSGLPAVRSWLHDTVADAGLGTSRASVLDLLTTEVVSNAIRHGDGDVRIRVEVTDDPAGRRVTVAVHDSSALLPEVRSAAPDARGGRGMALVQALADAWGVQVRPPAGGSPASGAWPATDPGDRHHDQDDQDDRDDAAGSSGLTRVGKVVWFRLVVDA